jgi:hypothetical protein
MNTTPELIPIDLIVDSPWRDRELFPVDPDHVVNLSLSIDEHTFFESLKGRRREGNVETGCGHSRIDAARLAGLTHIPMYIDDDMDDDAMLRLMVDENALQGGAANPGSIINEVAAVIRRLIEGLFAEQGKVVPKAVRLAFESEDTKDAVFGNLKKRLSDPNADVTITYHTVLRYLGRGDESQARRGERPIREAISTLKQSGRYDKIIDEALRRHLASVPDMPEAKTKTLAEKKPPKPKKRILDERTASVFPTEHEFQAFREAVTTEAAQRVIPVESQYELAKEIMNPASRRGFANKRLGIPYIKTMVHAKVEEGLKKQRSINNEERDRYFREQIEAEIDAVLNSANGSLRSLMSGMVKLNALAHKYPMHPKIGGFSAKLDLLVGDIERLSARFNPNPKKSA